MSYQPLWLQNLVAYSIQAAVLVGAGTVMAALLRLRMPRVRLAYWQTMLALCVFLPLLQPWRPEIVAATGVVLSNITFAPEAAPSGPSLAEIVLYVILGGIALRALWMALGLGRLWVYRRQAQRIEQPPSAIKEAQRLAPISAGFFISRQIQTPATFGLFRPAILFPSRFLEIEPAMQKAVALHGLLHVERRDWLWNMFEELVLTLLWFHLPLWWVARSARLSREQVVDAEAVRRSRERRPYLKALLEMAWHPAPAESLPAPLFLRESQLAERVALMMKEVQMSRTRLTVSILTAAVTLLIAGVSIVRAFPLKSPALQADTPQVSSAAVAGAEADDSSSSPAVAAAQQESSIQSGGKVYDVGGDVQTPEPTYKPEPPYSEQALKNHLSGWVTLSAVVDATGKVASVREISKPLGQGLDQNAINTVRTWKFKPGTRNGIPVPVRVTIEINFQPDKKESAAAISSATPSHSHAQAKVSTPEVEANNNVPVEVDPAEIQRQVEQAMKQVQIAHENFAKIDQAKIQQQVEQAMKQLQKMNTPEMQLQMQKQMEQLQKLKSPEMQRKMAELTKQLAKMNSPEMQRKMQEVIRQAEKINSPEMRKKIADAMKQAQIAEEKAAKFNQAKIQEQLKQAMIQEKAAQLAAEKINRADIQKKLNEALEQAKEAQLANKKTSREELERQLQQTREQLRVVREQLEQARQKLNEQRRQMQKQQQGAGALAPSTPQPPQAVPAAPPANEPQPVPPPPESSGVSGGVPGGVPGGVAGGIPSVPSTPAIAPAPPEIHVPPPEN